MAAWSFVPSIIATLFGVAVSLGLGTLQIDAGLGEAFGLPSRIGLQPIIIAITAVDVIRRHSRERDPDHEVSTPGDYVGGRTQAVAKVLRRSSCPVSVPILPEPTSRIQFHLLMESTSP